MRKFALFAAVILFTTAGLTQSTPQFPHIVEGEVQVNDEPYTGTIEARAGGEVLDSTSLEEGSFGTNTAPLLVPSFSGEEIRFYVDGIYAGEDDDLDFESGATDQVDIDVETSEDEPTTVSRTVDVSDGEDRSVSVNLPEAASKQDTGVEQVDVSVSDEVENAEVNVTTSSQVEEESGDVGELPEADYHGSVAVETNLDDSAVTGGEISFRVSKDRVSDTSQVLLLHYDDGDFLGTVESEYLEDRTGERDDGYYYFRSDVPDFSTYAIGSDEQDPEAAVEEGARTVETDEEFTLDASPSSDNTEIESYRWSMANGEVLNGETVEYSYGSSDTYRVVLTVEDQAGNTDDLVFEIEVEEPPSSTSFDAGDAEEQQPEDQQTDSQDEQEQEQNQTQPEDDTQEQEPEATPSNETEQQNNRTSEQEETQQQQAQDQGPTGLFTASETGPIAVLVLAFAALGVVAYRREWVDPEQIYTDVSSRVESVLGSEEEESQEYSFK